MKIHGSHVLPVDQERAYQLLQDPGILASCMPGCEELVKIAEDTYQMKMKMVMAALSGQFDGKVRIADREPFSGFKLLVEGSGKIGFMKGEGKLTLTPSDMAAVGQRLLDTTSKMMIKRFFDKLREKAAAA
jgi:uncharacterized protein